MSDSLTLILFGAAGLAVVHTLLGPDHYLPFVALARAQSWSPAITIRNTLVCGTGHLLSSLLLVALAVPVGLALSRVESIEAIRGDLAGWALVLFGSSYLIWALARRRGRSKASSESDIASAAETSRHHGLWFLFPVFVLGPCEPIVPLLMAPAASGQPAVSLLAFLVFAVTTLVTMCIAVLVCLAGTSRVVVPALGQYAHAIAGLVVLTCGVGVLAGL